MKNTLDFCSENIQTIRHMYEQQIKLKPDISYSQFAEWWINPVFASQAQLIKLLLNSWSLVFGFRSAKSALLSTMHLQMTTKTWCWLAVLCWLLAVCCIEIYINPHPIYGGGGGILESLLLSFCPSDICPVGVSNFVRMISPELLEHF